MLRLIRSRAIARLLIVALVFASLLALPAFTSTASASRGPNVADPAVELQVDAESCPPMLARGSTGAWVQELQLELNTYPYEVSGPLLAADGIFGPKTENAVEMFQDYYGLDVDGIVGPQTWGQLGYC